MHKMLSRQDRGAHKYAVSQMTKLVQTRSSVGGQKERLGQDRLARESFLWRGFQRRGLCWAGFLVILKHLYFDYVSFDYPFFSLVLLTGK